MSAAGGLRFPFAVERPVPAEALNDHGAQAKEHCEEAGIEPSEIHRRTSAPSFALVRPRVDRATQPTFVGNIHARHFPRSSDEHGDSKLR